MNCNSFCISINKYFSTHAVLVFIVMQSFGILNAQVTVNNIAAITDDPDLSSEYIIADTVRLVEKSGDVGYFHDHTAAIRVSGLSSMVETCYSELRGKLSTDDQALTLTLTQQPVQVNDCNINRIVNTNVTLEDLNNFSKYESEYVLLKNLSLNQYGSKLELEEGYSVQDFDNIEVYTLFDISVGDTNDIGIGETIPMNSNIGGIVAKKDNKLIIYPTSEIGIEALPNDVEQIHANTQACLNSTYRVSIDPILYADSIEWLLPNGAVHIGKDTVKILDITQSIPAGAEIKVRGKNKNGEGGYGTISLNIASVPELKSEINGNSNLCRGDSIYEYSILGDISAMEYDWILTEGMIGSGEAESINVYINEQTQSGTISVTASNACGTSDTKELLVEINDSPEIPEIVQKGENILICLDSGMFSYQWYKGADEQIINDANDQFYYSENLSAESIYSVEVIDTFGCSARSDLKSINLKAESGLKFVLSPNPTNNSEFSIHLDNQVSGIFKINIYNANGVMVTSEWIDLSSQTNEIKLNAQNFNKGVYFVKLSGKPGEYVQKLIVY